MLIPLTETENAKMTDFYAYLDGKTNNVVLPEHLRKVVDVTHDNEVVSAASMLYYAKDKEAAQVHLKNVVECKYPDTDSFLTGGQNFAGWVVPLLVAALVVTVVVELVLVSGPQPLPG